MKEKKYTQWGIAMMVLFVPIIIVLLRLVIMLIHETIPFCILLFLIVIFSLCLLCFYKLTITIDDTFISFKLGIGLIKKSYKISNIKSCKPVTNSIFYGLGVRIIYNGVLYNVSGLKAIELQFLDSKSVVRIGTNQPEKISRQMESLIGKNITTSNLQTSNNNHKGFALAFLITMILTVITLLVSSTEAIKDTMVEINDENLIMKGSFGISVPLSEIVQVDTVSNLSIRRVRGYGFAGTIKGDCRLSDGTLVKGYVKTNYKPYILIKRKDENKPVCISFKDKQKTINLYNQLRKINEYEMAN